jgi:hypothetical protein
MYIDHDIPAYIEFFQDSSPDSFDVFIQTFHRR